METSFSHYKPMGIFFRHSRATNSAVCGPIRLKFTRPSSHACHRYLQLLNGMYEKQPSKSGDIVFPIITISLPWKPVFRSGGISNSSKLSCMLSLPASMKRIRLRTAEKKWRHHFSHYKPMGIFSDFQGQLTPQWVVQSS